MTLLRSRYALLSLAALATGLAPLHGQTAQKTEIPFGSLQCPSSETARAQGLAWLSGTGKIDPDTLKEFERIWNTDASLLDRVTATLALGDPDAAQLLAEVRDSSSTAPTRVPALLTDARRSPYCRANLALAYARELSSRRVYEEVLATLEGVKVEQVVDPGTYLFHKAVAEHGLTRRHEAERTLGRLIEDVADAPERYLTLSTLMLADMQTWQERDLGTISRLMRNIERRLDLARGGPGTQRMQKEALARLDELIRALEEPPGDGPRTPRPGDPRPGPEEHPGPQDANNPLPDSIPGGIPGKGNVDPRNWRELAEVWGKLPARNRPAALAGLMRDLPPRYRALIEKYFRELSLAETVKR